MLAPDYTHALDKIRPRWPEFFAAGWSQLELTCCDLARHGHHGLALALRPDWDLGRIWPWCCEILASRTGTGERSRLYYWRSAPEASLLATVGLSIVPAELRAERAGVIV